MPPPDPDPLRSASHRNLAAHLSGPLAAGAADARLAVDGAGRVAFTDASREPLLLVAPQAPLGPAGLLVRATLDPDGAATALPELGFAPWTEAGAFLPLDPLPRRTATAGTAARTLGPLTVSLAVAELAADGTETPLATAEVAARVEVRLLQGVLGRLVYLLGAEKQRLRRQARELAAMRLLPLARGDALDRLGADLAVPRFADQIRYDAAKKEIVTETRTDAAGRPTREPDDEYRRRLAIYRPFLLPTPRRLRELLNGPGADADPNRGLFEGLGLGARFRLLEADNEFAVAVHLVAAGGDQFRTNFLAHARAAYLVWPAAGAVGDAAHAQRYLSAAQDKRAEELRARLRQTFQFAGAAAVAPMLATALDRAGLCRAALGGAAPWPVLRAQDDAGGSRYELGLGVDVAPLPPADLDALADRLRDPARPPAGDEVEALLRSLTPRPAADDPEGRWLLEPCGLRTVHRLDAGRIYLSHLPTFGMAITAPSSAAVGAQVNLEVRYEAPGTPGSNVVLATGLQAALGQWTAGGGPAWTVLSEADAQARWGQAGPRPENDPALGVLRAAGLPALTNPAPTVARLSQVPPELLETIVLAGPQAQRILAGQPDAAEELRRLVDVLRGQGLTSALPLVTGPNEVVLVVGVIGLPEAGLNLSERRATGFRWYAVPIAGPGGTIKPVGSRTAFVPQGEGLTALVALGYARRGLTDPYEYRVELPPEARLSLTQYEYLMNLLDATYPLGVEVNTFAVRARHVDLDGDGAPERLPPSVARTYRQFHRPRLLGEVAVTLDNP
jgi:hypothetical protein